MLCLKCFHTVFLGFYKRKDFKEEDWCLVKCPTPVKEKRTAANTKQGLKEKQVQYIIGLCYKNSTLNTNHISCQMVMIIHCCRPKVINQCQTRVGLRGFRQFDKHFIWSIPTPWKMEDSLACSINGASRFIPDCVDMGSWRNDLWGDAALSCLLRLGTIHFANCVQMRELEKHLNSGHKYSHLRSVVTEEPQCNNRSIVREKQGVLRHRR